MTKTFKNIIMISLIFCTFVFMLTLLDFAALHDIKNDYVSQSILDYLKINTSQNLPEWTNTRGEWQVVTFSLITRFLFLILNTFILIYLYRKIIPQADSNK
ncbi:MAG: hypothetical protein JW956_13740 [Calditrichaceae bacterium]|nr:hypothetical protein [Calditrichaceae bacterium]